MGPALANLLFKSVSESEAAYIGPHHMRIDFPVCNSDDLGSVQAQTIAYTLLGMLMLLYEIWRKQGEKVSYFS